MDIDTDDGFTLIELSIVLVIVAVVVGGILVGRDLIRAAEQRKVISQIESIQSSMNVFRLKYNQIPGDLSRASSYWPTAINGDNDGYLEYDSVGLVWEAYNFWHHLAQAGLAAGKFSPVNANPAPTYIPGSDDLALRAGLFGKFLTVIYAAPYSDSTHPHNYINLRGLPFAGGAFDDLGMMLNSPSYGISPRDAVGIDVKLDDGRPLTGKVLSALEATGSDASSCPDESGSNHYNLDSSGTGCILWTRLGAE